MVSNLQYAITRKTPVSQKALKWALQAQSLLNEKGILGQDRLTLTPVAGASERQTYSFPLIRVAPMKIGPYSVQEPSGESQPVVPNAVAAGSTKARDLFAAHAVAAYLRVLSENHPDLVIDLRDETGQFVIPLGVFLRAGRFEINRALLNAQRERAIEATGDPNAGGPFLWAEAKALAGEFLMDVPVSDYMEVPPIILDRDPEAYVGASVGDVATHYVRQVLSELAPVAA